MNGAARKSILATISIIAVGAIGASALKPESTVQILGFASVICVSLLQLLHQVKVADNVNEVKTTLANNTVSSERKMDALVTKVEEVHLATNSLTDRLVESTAKESHAAGMKEERERPK